MHAACPSCGSHATTAEAGGGSRRCTRCGVRFEAGVAATALGPELPPQPPAGWAPSAGDRCGSYTLVAELGRGGMATVWRAQSATGSPVACKILHAHLCADDELRRRFGREAEALTRLDHPGILPVLDRGEDRGRPWLVTPLASAGSLRDRLAREGRCDSSQVADWCAQICAALAHAHGRGLVHRDLKPENLLLEDDGRIRLADFGIAHWLGGSDLATLTRLTRTDMVVGTVAYMAPEQAEAGSAVDGRADLYALGVIAYEALAGHRPVGRFEDPSAVLVSLPPHQRAAWDRVLLALLERDPQRRPADAVAARGLLEPLVPRPPAPAPDAIPTASAPPCPVAPSAATERAAKALVRYRGEGFQARIQHARMQRQARRRQARRAGEQAPPDDGRHGRALYRPRIGGWFGGVCAGLGVWTGINPGWWRLLALALLPMGFLILVPVYLLMVVFIPLCPDLHYRPRPLNRGLPRRGLGWFFGVCDLLGRASPLPAWAWRIIAACTAPVSILPYLVLAILLPPWAPPARALAAGKAPPGAAQAVASAPAMTTDGAGARFWGVFALVALGCALAVGRLVALGRAPDQLLGNLFLWTTAIAAGVVALGCATRGAAGQVRGGGGGGGLALGGGLVLATTLALYRSGTPPLDPNDGAALALLGCAAIACGCLWGLLRGRPAAVAAGSAAAIGLGLAGLATLGGWSHGWWWPGTLSALMPATLLWLLLLLPWLAAHRGLHWLLVPVGRPDQGPQQGVLMWILGIATLGACIISAAGLAPDPLAALQRIPDWWAAVPAAAGG